MSDVIGLRFAGAYRDSITAGYPLGDGYRWYLPGLMRFNAPDEESPFGPGGLNPYSYCGDDPVNHRDPTGHMSFGVLRRLFVSGASEADASGRGTVSDASVAAQSATDASADGVGSQGREEPPPAYVERANSVELPPAYSQINPYPPLPSFHVTVAIPIYREIRHDLSTLSRDISGEWLRRFGSERPASARLPSIQDLTRAFFTDKQKYTRLRAWRAAEFIRRKQNSTDYRVRLNYIERRIREEPALDREARLKQSLEESLKKAQRLYRILES